MTTSTPTAPTIGRVKDLIDLTASMVTNEGVEMTLDASNFRDIVEGVNKNLQLRDYLMGLPMTYTIGESLAIVQFFRDNLDADDEQGIPFDTIAGAFYYEIEALDLALLLNSRGVDEKYPLAELLHRVYAAGWPAANFATMRNELHIKVVKTLEEIAGDLVA
jgi:hypothetical protein